MPKAYGFDSGGVRCHRGRSALRREDLGLRREHFVLNELLAAVQGQPFLYWGGKAGHDVDFVLGRRGRLPLAIRCEWSAAGRSIGNPRAFRSRYPEGEDVPVVQDVDRSVTRSLGGIRVMVELLPDLIRRLRGKQGKPARR